jgi:predicted nucleic acid-binding protein
MAVVVDASAVAAMAFDESQAMEMARHLGGHELYAPTLLDYELASIAWKKLRRHPDQREAILAGFSQARQLRIERVAPAMPEVLALAHALDVTPYDASYVWVARSLSVRLVTLDKELARAAESF